MIRLKKIIADDFCAYEHVEFDFINGIHAIQGLNGRGKTTIFMAVQQCLFNRNSKGLKVSECFNQITNKPYELDLYFEKDVDAYRVVNSKKTETLKLYKNGRDISLKKIPEVLGQIADIVGDFATATDLLYQGVKSSINLLEVSSDGERKRFLNRILKFQELDELLSKVSDKAKELSGKNGRIATLTSQISSLEQALGTPQEIEEEVDTAELEKEIAAARDEKEKLTKQKLEVEQEIKQFRQQIEQLRKDEEVNKRIADLEGELLVIVLPEPSEEDLQEEYNKISGDKIKQEGVIAQAQKDIEAARAYDRELDKLQAYEQELAELSVSDKSLEFLEDNLNKLNKLKATKESEKKQAEKEIASYQSATQTGACPTCGHEVSKDKFKVEIEKLTVDLSCAEETLSKCNESIPKYQKLITDAKRRAFLENEVEKIKINPASKIDLVGVTKTRDLLVKLIESYNKKLPLLTSDLATIKQHRNMEAELSKLKGSVTSTGDTKAVQDELVKVNNRWIELEGNLNASTKSIAEKEAVVKQAVDHNTKVRTLKQVNQQIEEQNRKINLQLDHLKKDLVGAEETLEICKAWQGILGAKGFRVSKMKRFLNNLNTTFAKYSAMISGGTISCVFDTDEEGEVVFEITDSNKSVAFGGWSVGEASRIKNACLFAILELLEGMGSTCFSTLCLDDVWGPLDQEGKEGLFRVLEYLRGKGRAIYTVSQEELVNSALFDSVIYATKDEKGICYLTQ